MKVLIGSVVIAALFVGYLVIDAGKDAATAVAAGGSVPQFIVSHWYVWLVVALLAGCLWFASALGSAATILRGGRGGAGPWKTPALIKLSAAFGALLFLAAVALRLLS